MYKTLSAFGLYWHFVLDIILTHVYVIAFLHAGHASIAGFLMSVDSLYKAILMIVISRFTISLPPWLRGRISLFLRAILILLWSIAINQLSLNEISLLFFLPFIFFKLVLVIDSSISADFIFRLKEHYFIDITQSTAAQNILVRSSIAIAPALALTLLRVPQANLIIVVLMSTIGLFCSILLRNVFFTFEEDKITSNQNKYVPLNKLVANPLMRWGLFYQVAGNLAFAGVAFLLLAQLNVNAGLFLNEITALYTLFFIMQCFVLIFGDKIIPATKLSHVAFIMIICGTLVVLIGATHGTIRLFICGMTGLMYSLLLPASQKVITYRLKGNGFIEYSSLAMTVGRLSSFSTAILLGALLSTGFSPSLLLIFCGLLGIVSAISLEILAKRSSLDN